MSVGEERGDRRVVADANAPLALIKVAITHSDGGAAGSIVNLAEEALYLATEVKAELGSWVGVRIVVGGERCDARGKVVWQGDNGLGIRLIRVHESFRSFVRRLAAAGGESDEVLSAVQEAGVMIGR